MHLLKQSQQSVTMREPTMTYFCNGCAISLLIRSLAGFNQQEGVVDFRRSWKPQGFGRS